MADDNFGSIANNPFLQSFFFTSGPGVNMKLREKIALAQMIQKQARPRNFGEGLSAIGEALGERRSMIDLERQDRIAQEGAMAGPPADASSTIKPMAYAPTEDVPQETMLRPPIAAAQPQQSRPPPQPEVIELPPPPLYAPPPPSNLPPAAPAAPLPPDQQQSYAPGAPVRMPSAAAVDDWRAQNPPPPGLPSPRGIPAVPPSAAPPPPLPPDAPAQGFEDRFGAAFPGRRSEAPPPFGAPVMAFGGEPSEDVPPPANPRDLAAMALMQQTAGGPQANPTMPAGGGPPPDALALAGNDQGIRPAPSPGVQVAQAGPPQPDAIPGYVPPQRADPTGAPAIPMSPRELVLRHWMARNQGNPYVGQSPAAVELQRLEAERTMRQTEQNELFKANIARTTKREEQREQARIDQDKRILESQQSRITIGDLPSKLQQEGEKRLLEIQKGRQELIALGTETAGAPDPRLGTPQSPQRSGMPTTPPVPAGVAPQKWAELHAPEHQKAIAAAESATPDFQRMLDTIKLARDHPGKYWGTGLTSYVTPRGSDQYDFSAVVDQLKGKNFLVGYQKLKGGGAVSEIEGSKTEQSQARLDRASSQEAFDAGLNDLEKSVRSDLEALQRKVNQPVTAWQRSNEDPPAPDKGQVVGGFSDGKTRVYLGGDPSDLKGSWRVVR